MTISYVNLDSPGAWNGRDGTDHTGNEWLGLSGLQYAADTITAGNSVHIKGTVVCTNLLDVSHDAWSGTALTRGEACSWDSGGTGIVSEPNTSNISGIVIEKLSGNNPIDNETITGTTSGQTVTVDASASSVKATGLDLDTNAGTVADGFIKFIGVNGSWIDDETRAKLDGNAGAIAGCTSIIYRVKSFLYFKNIEVDDSDGVGFERTTATGNCLFINCWAHHCDDIGFKSYNVDKHIRCLSTHNGGSGLRLSASSSCILCVSHNNSNGIEFFATGCAVLCCISAENTSSGIFGDAGGNIVLFNVVDENTDGIYFDASTNAVALFNRITNQTDDGIVVTAGESCYEDWNLLYGNAGDNYNDTAGAGLIEKGGNSKTDGAADGYADQAGHDFNLTDAADYRREAITLPKWDGTSP